MEYSDKDKIRAHCLRLLDRLRYSQQDYIQGKILKIHYQIAFNDTIRIIKRLRSGFYKIE